MQEQHQRLSAALEEEKDKHAQIISVALQEAETKHKVRMCIRMLNIMCTAYNSGLSLNKLEGTKLNVLVNWH